MSINNVKNLFTTVHTSVIIIMHTYMCAFLAQGRGGGFAGGGGVVVTNSFFNKTIFFIISN